MNTIPAYDGEAVGTLRDLDRQRLLGHLRDQRPDGMALEEPVEPARAEPPATAPVPGLSVAVFDRASVLKQLRLVVPGDDIGEGGPSSSASSDEQGRVERLRALVREEPLRRLVVADDGTIERLGGLREECPGFVEIIALVERATALSMAAGTGIALPPILLVGPPAWARPTSPAGSPRRSASSSTHSAARPTRMRRRSPSATRRPGAAHAWAC